MIFLGSIEAGNASDPSFGYSRSFPSTPSRVEDYVVNKLATADNFYYREPWPALPDANPFDFLHDTRAWLPPSLAAQRSALTDSYTRTGFAEVRASSGYAATYTCLYTRTARYINPMQDVAYQALLYYNALVDARADTHARPAGVTPHFFWALGNPPLLDADASAMFVDVLTRGGLLDSDGLPIRLLHERDLKVLLGVQKALGKRCGEDFARYAAVALQAIYDTRTYGRLNAWTSLYKFSTLNDAQRAMPSGTRERLQMSHSPETLRARAKEVEALLASGYRAYLKELAQEAALAGATTSAKT